MPAHAQYDCPLRFFDSFGRPLPGFLRTREHYPSAWSNCDLVPAARRALAAHLSEFYIPAHRRFCVTAQGGPGLQLLNSPRLTYEPDWARICLPALFPDQPSTALCSLPPLSTLHRPSRLPLAHALTCSPAHARARQAQRQHPAHILCTRPGPTTHAPSHRLARPPAASRPLHWPVPLSPRPCHRSISPAACAVPTAT